MTPKKEFKDGHEVFEFTENWGIFCPKDEDLVLWTKEPKLCPMCGKDLKLIAIELHNERHLEPSRLHNRILKLERHIENQIKF